MIKKTYDVTLSHKMPTGDILSVRFGTVASLDEDFSEDTASKLFEKVYKSTIADIKCHAKKDKLIKTAYKGIQRGIKKYETEKEVIEELSKLWVWK